MRVWVTGSNGLIGSAVVKRFCKDCAISVTGIDNDSRAEFFGKEASTFQVGLNLLQEHRGYDWMSLDIVDAEAAFRQETPDVIVHCAAQPSHDKAASIALRDFEVNALGTVKLLEGLRHTNPNGVFVFLSTNKVYGDRPNSLYLRELATRYEIHPYSDWKNGISETMPVDQCKHSVFGASKLAADIYVQEYGRYFGLNTVVLRGGCLTGSAHCGAELHGFLSYLAKCVVEERPYTIFGYKGKQVRDNIHADDVAEIVWRVAMNPPDPGTVYNVGGERERTCSVQEAISAFQNLSGKRLEFHYDDQARSGDHKWYSTDMTKFKQDYPDWNFAYSLEAIYEEIYKGLVHE